MKTLKHILLAVLLGLNLVSCDPPSVNEEVGVDKLKFFSSEEDSGEIEAEEDSK